jgi:hypothetical protein
VVPSPGKPRSCWATSSAGRAATAGGRGQSRTHARGEAGGATAPGHDHRRQATGSDHSVATPGPASSRTGCRPCRRVPAAAPRRRPPPSARLRRVVGEDGADLALTRDLLVRQHPARQLVDLRDRPAGACSRRRRPRPRAARCSDRRRGCRRTTGRAGDEVAWLISTGAKRSVRKDCSQSAAAATTARPTAVRRRHGGGTRGRCAHGVAAAAAGTSACCGAASGRPRCATGATRPGSTSTSAARCRPRARRARTRRARVAEAAVARRGTGQPAACSGRGRGWRGLL